MNDSLAASPSSTGPAGPLFEAQVAAHYLLTMLAEADPRGLPGVLMQRVELQRAGEGYPLDDVIIRGITRAGDAAVLEVQAKRTITFAPSDPVFKDVGEQLARAFPQLDLSHQHHQFAVATERTSYKITGPYQDVLRWAREVSSASTFIERINRHKVGNDDMRTFVATFRSHLVAAGCAHDDETIWQILRRFQILTFDYDAPGSQSLELVLDRVRHILEPEEATRASGFWKALTETAIRVAASGGDLDRVRLLAELQSIDSFRVLGSSRNRAPRAILTEVASLAVADFRRTIAGVTLARSAQLDSVREAREVGRYIEIRGGAGVGKSGVLGMLVQQQLIEAHAIVLSPERTVAGGWLALKTTLGVNLSPQEFLTDLASDGGAVLFVDSLDFFDDPAKRATVSDLVRSAAEVPNFHVIVTARTDFDKDEPNWLPLEALTRLGRAPPIVISELGSEEVEELKAATPTLRALLADNHPARAIARNLFRLSRLLEVQGSTDTLRTEVDLIDRWWTTADGATEGRRERVRVLADLADASLAGSQYIETRAAPAAVDTLIASETLRELGLDQFAFRHDVLREWGIAARLHDNPGKLTQLPLHLPAPAALARGVELGARFALERSEAGERWVSYLRQVSLGAAHGSWRRWSLLAILRSELAFTLLNRAAASLFAHDGALLQELIRTTIATESRPLAQMWAELVADVSVIPSGIYGPSNGSWVRLTQWLLARRDDLPLHALPDVVELFQSLSASMFFADPLTPRMAEALASWLEEIEDAGERNPLTDQPRFVAAFRYHGLYRLAEDVRHAFVLMAARVPARARSYLQGVLKRQKSDEVVRDIKRLRGSLAQAAPAELVEIMIAGLVPKAEADDRYRERSIRREIFTDLDSDFLPSSPAQGPFLELLNSAPEHGLALIRHLVDHAVAVLFDKQEPSDDGITLMFPSGPRLFPMERSYYWSRNAESCYSIESGLMALEAWSHSRVERGDAPDQVIADILGPEGSPAAFVLVAVDVLISHWPKTMNVVAPFLGSPELLSLERSRQGHDSMPEVDLLGWGAIGPKEPKGTVQLADLKRRLSRRVPLEQLLGAFALNKNADHDELSSLLEAASLRLGAPEPNDTFADPRFMARSALNLINPANWHPKDGGFAYVSPPDEEQHLINLQAKRAPQTLDFNVDTAIQNALENTGRSGPELAQHALAYAKRLESASDTPEDVLRSRTNAIVSAAMILARDGTDQQVDEHEDWMRGVFAKTFESTKRDIGGEMRDGIRFNPVAIATLGLIHLWRRRGEAADRDSLLALAGRDTADAAQGFGAGIETIREIDHRMIPAALRCALTAQINPIRNWKDSEEEKLADHARHREKSTATIIAEQAWLRDQAEEPSWPSFPMHRIHIRRGLRIGGDEFTDQPSTAPDPATEELYTQSAALWVRQLTRDSTRGDADWLGTFITAYSDWTAKANGKDLESHVEIDNRLHEWNSAFFRLLARTLPRVKQDEAAAQVARAIAIPDNSFFDIAVELVRAIDELHFNGLGLDLETTLLLRGLIADKLTASVGWRRERDRSELSVEMRIGPAIGVLFFNNYGSFSGSRCYLLAKGIDQILPFLSHLTRLIEDGPVPFTAMLTMNLLEVSPNPRHVSFFLSSALTWLRRQPENTRLWADGGLGERLVKWLEAVIKTDASIRAVGYHLRPQMDEMLARLVQVGIADAYRLELELAGG